MTKCYIVVSVQHLLSDKRKRSRLRRAVMTGRRGNRDDEEEKSEEEKDEEEEGEDEEEDEEEVRTEREKGVG